MRDAKEIARQVHRRRALAVLGNDPSCQWLTAHSEIVEELGRIDSDHALRVIARRISDLQLPPAEAVALIRRHREFDQLAYAIVKVVDEYCRKRPETTRREIVQALETAQMTLAQPAQSTEAGRHQYLCQI